MEFKQFEDVHEFSVKAEPILVEREDVHSLFFGVLQAIKAGRYENPFMAIIEEGGEVLALCQMTPPHSLNLIIVDEKRSTEIMDLLIINLLNSAIEIPSIISSKQDAYCFAKKWESETGMLRNLLFDQGVYRLDQVDENLQKSQGIWRLAEEKDCPLIERWFNLFEEDAELPLTSIEEVKQRVSQFIGEREVFLWEHDGKIVSMMKRARPTKHSVTVSFVFTPKEERRKGYARTMVAACSKELLKEYAFCVLYTDLKNETANKIYQEIGYKKIADSVQLEFLKNPS